MYVYIYIVVSTGHYAYGRENRYGLQRAVAYPNVSLLKTRHPPRHTQKTITFYADAEYNTCVQVRSRLSDVVIDVLAIKDFQPKPFSHRYATRTTFTIIKRFDLFLSPVDTIKKYIIINLIRTPPYIRDFFVLYKLLGKYFSIFYYLSLHVSYSSDKNENRFF